MKKSAIEKMMDGYNVTERDQDGGEEIKTIKKGDKNQRRLSPIEMLMNGYNEDSTQRQEEVEINPNDVKEEDK
ncbi:hypothetical protein U9J35_01600 [Rossellomorea aquimaris]|nr:hypothetical protein [Rossellomorea aquimaris]WRP06891.1 hypothetical protein U9J35_01600 [Rossellomorea aquimaris]